jgi:hypothetical protein
MCMIRPCKRVESSGSMIGIGSQLEKRLFRESALRLVFRPLFRLIVLMLLVFVRLNHV